MRWMKDAYNEAAVTAGVLQLIASNNWPAKLA